MMLMNLRGIVVEHQGDFHVHVYSEVGSKDISTKLPEGILLSLIFRASQLSPMSGFVKFWCGEKLRADEKEW